MTVKAPGSNSPLHRREERALKRLEVLTAKYVDEGMPEPEAKERALAEMRDNPRGDWRAG